MQRTIISDVFVLLDWQLQTILGWQLHFNPCCCGRPVQQKKGRGRTASRAVARPTV